MMQTQTMPARERELSDADLAAAIRGGDQHAFALLMRRMNRPLYRTARSILRDDGEAEDALQDAYLQAFRGIHAWRGDATLKTWLTRIVVNEAIARSRKSRRRAAVIVLHGADGADGEEPQAGDAEANTPEQPEQSALRAQLRAALEGSIDALPEAFRTVFVLRAVEEMGVDEVAACLGIPEATVRSRFFRARSLLRQALSRQLDVATADAFGFDGARCDRIVDAVLRRLRAAPDGVP
jgi:RNA polymerase sigma-70 factor (ECF subfamily)